VLEYLNMGVERALPALRADVELGYVNNDGDNFNNITALLVLFSWVKRTGIIGNHLPLEICVR
jgi:hypothetical protein